MKRTWLAAIVLFTLAIRIEAQTIQEIKTSDQYIWGEGKGSNLRQADKAAINDLISQISIQVESKFINRVTEEDGDVSEFTKVVLSTYSATTLNQAQRKVIEKRREVTVLRYIAKVDLDRLFDARKAKVIDYARTALQAEEEGRIGDALRYYYWALVLLRSHPDYSTITLDVPGQGNRLLLTTLPDRMNRIFAQLKISVEKIEDHPEGPSRTLVLDLRYQDEPVGNLDYMYWSGDTWTRLVSAKDGLGVVEFFGEASRSLNTLRLKVEYTYENKSKVDLELRKVLGETDTPFFAKADFKIPIHGHRDITPVVETFTAPEKAGDYEAVVYSVVQAIAQSDFSGVESYFTEKGYDMFQRLIRYGKAKVIPVDVQLETAEINNTVMVRSVPMMFSFPNNDRAFIEEVVFIFDQDKKIDALSFALSGKAIQDILDKGDRFGTPQHKYQLIQFMEQYKTAYCLERIDYIESIFADNALIIVGQVLREAEPIDGMYTLLGDRVRYVQLAKKEYIERLKGVFARNEFVNIHFEENTVKKVGGEDKVYGIQIAQHYYSANYADKGYLFLMIDLNKPKQPKIYVRSWQPEKSPDGSVIGLSDFYF